MSDPMIGAVTQLLVNNLYDIIKSESKYAINFQTDLKEMEAQLKLMQSFLIDANKHKQKHETVKEILNSLRELIYEADDVIVDCQIRGYRQKMRGAPSCSLPSLREIVFRNQTGKKLSEINKRIRELGKNLSDFVTPILGSHSNEDYGGKRRRWTSQDIDQSEIVGLAKDTRRIKRWILTENESHNRIGIVGMGGLGKTTLAKKIFHDTQVMARYVERIWVSISQTFNEVEIMKSMLKQLGADASGSDSGDLWHRICQKLSQKSYIIVMDDVWSTGNGWWDQISDGLPKLDEHSSCVIITSRNKYVVKRMGVMESRIHQPKFLTEDESWILFSKVAFNSSEGRCKNAQLEGVGKEIVKKCDGLPLAIKATGGLLASKPQSFGEWKRICDNFHGKLETESESSTSVMASLQLSYDELPPRLKHCVLCFSVYPEDYEIDAGQLVHWWVGEGFVLDTRSETAMELAYDCLVELNNRCLVETVHRRKFDGRVQFCKVHDMVRELLIKIAREESFCTFDERGVQIARIDSRRLGVKEDTKFQSLQGNMKLRALLLMTFRSIGFNKHISLANVMSLRVLDFSYLNLDNICLEDLWRWITSLRRLAYLNLREVGKLRELPDSIRKLWALQILILGDNRNLEKLPTSIITLPRLAILDVGNCQSLRYLPRGLSKLVSLNELYGFKTTGPNNDEGCRFGELKAFTKLRVLQLDITDDTTIDDEELTALEKLEHLKVFSINAGDVEDLEVLTKLDKLLPPPSIEELYLRHFCGETAPAWINPTRLPQLRYLCIESSRTLAKMSTTFWNNDECKWNIEGLCLKYLPRLQMTWTELKITTTLRYVEVSHCNSLESFPCDVIGVGYWRQEEEDKAEGAPEELLVSEVCDVADEIV